MLFGGLQEVFGEPKSQDNDLVNFGYGECAASCQPDRTKTVEYDLEYYQNYVGYENNDKSDAINSSRIALVKRHVDNKILDIGVGSGLFVRTFPGHCLGFDVNQVAVKILKNQGKFYNLDKYGLPEGKFQGITLWDVFEHFAEPGDFLKSFPNNTYLFMSIPIFNELDKVKQSKHYKPNEHYFYFTKLGLKKYLNHYGFRCIEYNNCETAICREGIGCFAFKKS